MDKAENGIQRSEAECKLLRGTNARLDQAMWERDEIVGRLQKNAKELNAERNKQRKKIEGLDEKMTDLRKKCEVSDEACNVEKTRRIEAEKLSQQRKVECGESLRALQDERAINEARYTNIESELAECKKKLGCAKEQKSFEAERADRENMDMMEKTARVECSESPGADPLNSSEVLASQRDDRGKVSKMETNEKPEEQDSAVADGIVLGRDDRPVTGSE